MKLEIISCEIKQTWESWSTVWFLDLVANNNRKNLSSHETKERAERAKRRWLKENGKSI